LKEIRTHKGPKNENMGNIMRPLEYKDNTNYFTRERVVDEGKGLGFSV